MEWIIDFCIRNWKFLLEIALTVVVILISVFKKKTVISTDGLNKVLMALPGYISEAEKMFDDGKTKFNYVYQLALENLREVYSDEIIITI